MNRKLAASALAVLLYAQGLVGIAALAAVVLGGHPAGMVRTVDGPSETIYPVDMAGDATMAVS